MKIQQHSNKAKASFCQTSGQPYQTDVVSYTNYYPFGMEQSGRCYAGGSHYRFGYNGKEEDGELQGEGNSYDYGFRIYNPRIGRFLSVDPLTDSYPWYTPYQYAGNKPIAYVDVDGLEEGKSSSWDPETDSYWLREVTVTAKRYDSPEESTGGGLIGSFPGNHNSKEQCEYGNAECPTWKQAQELYYDYNHSAYEEGYYYNKLLHYVRNAYSYSTKYKEPIPLLGGMSDDEYYWYSYYKIPLHEPSLIERGMVVQGIRELQEPLMGPMPMKGGSSGGSEGSGGSVVRSGFGSKGGARGNAVEEVQADAGGIAGKGGIRSLNELSSLRGAPWDEAISLIPKNWISGPLKEGEGLKFVNPAKKGEQILFEKGWPGAKDPLHAGPYLRISRDGKITRIPLEGNPTLR